MILAMAEDKENIHTILHTLYEKGDKAAEAARKVNDVMGADVISPRQAQKWFKQFREGRRSGKRKSGSGRPPPLDKRALAQRQRRHPDNSCAGLARGHCKKYTA